MNIAKDKVVSIEYTLTNDHGEVLDSSSGKDPLAYMHGGGGLISGLEKKLEGKVKGDKLIAIIPPGESSMNRINTARIIHLISLLITGLILASCTTPQPIIIPVQSVPVKPAPVKHDFEIPREFRAAWVATVANIDWPSKPGLSTEQQQAEAISLLDSAVILNLNAIIFQVRPQCDALYESDLEPWSYFLTGEQGSPPDPYYDPLTFWVAEAHKRGLELHTWFNPYRAHHPSGKKNETSVISTHPDIVRKIDKGYYWLDPAKQETQDYSYEVVMDVVRRYDIDGVHFDDYFYPYGNDPFPDDDTWQTYLVHRGKLGRDDWRRNAVNVFIKRVYDGIKAEKSWVKFGLSPFGIWRPGNPPSIQGYDQYDKLYADAKLWLNEGWVDYWTPQLYWPTRQLPQSYPVLLGWWTRENTHDRNLWPGLFTSKIKDEAGALENFSQIMITRGMVPDGPGNVHFSMKALQRNYGGISDILIAGPYAQPALVPPSPWLDDQAPAAPLVEVDHKAGNIHIN
ncbi:MAG: family 10 glycosylhydrolase, partial [Candidatus Marinimicrobia bacterium]|nr:family 10 glycosylhydrolase [Candidatus Neomarinimicrobiota bacterium]